MATTHPLALQSCLFCTDQEYPLLVSPCLDNLYNPVWEMCLLPPLSNDT